MVVLSSAGERPDIRFPFEKVHRLKIHPGIGIARIGNSPEEYFIGPEAPCRANEVTVPDGGFKDGDGFVKRQGARFRIYAYDNEGRNLGELPFGTKDDRHVVGAEVTWTVHLANKKGAWYKYDSEPANRRVRNPDVPLAPGKAPDARSELVIDPGARSIDGQGHSVGRKGASLHFDTGEFRGTKVTLGELRVDSHGRLIVLGGFGHSGTTKPDNPIGADPTKDDYWADNDYWYDDISDGPVTALVRLPGGKEISIDSAADAAWVIVAPPKYAPAIFPVVTLYDVMREVAIDKGWVNDDGRVEYYRDICPILRRAANMTWVNDEAKRGHGFDKRWDFNMQGDRVRRESGKKKIASKFRVTEALLSSRKLAAPGDDAEYRRAIFSRLRRPVNKLMESGQYSEEAKRQANYDYMPPLSGDGGDRTPGEPDTWLSVLPSQYRKFEKWSIGDFEVDNQPVCLSIDDEPEAQTEALQRAALEPCIGGPFHPGIEAPRCVRDAGLYSAAFRINSAECGPGDITKSLCVPWQADFYECRGSWWPSARPDDVIPEEVFLEANKAWVAGQPRVSEALEGRVRWDRGLGVTTLFRRPWQNPAEAMDDPRDRSRRGCDDMVRYWHELGFVLPRQTAWRALDSDDFEHVHIETERRPHAGMDVRELFHCLLNMDERRSCLPKVEEFVCNVLAAARALQQTANAFAWMDNIRPFKYDEDVFDGRMQEIYDDCADFAFTEKLGKGRVPYDPADPEQNPYFRTRENVIERVRQLTPFNFIDGSWLRNIHRVGPVDEVNAILFTILKEELGDGVVSQNHANIYRELCHSFGFYPAPMESTAFAYDETFLDCAFDSPAFQLGISEFSRRFYPEIIGMSLWLEWTVMELHRIAAIVENVGLSSHYYRMHIAIDNAASGHGGAIIRAVKLYLRQVRNEGGEDAVQQHWERIWDGYVAFAYTFVIVIRQVIRIIQKPPTLEQRLERLIREKAPFGQYNHGTRELDGSSINSLFSNPKEFLGALVRSGSIIPGKPDQSPFFKLLEFRGGRMYHVFTEDEVQLWRDWTYDLAHKRKRPKNDNVRVLRERLALVDPNLTERISHDKIAGWQSAVADHRIVLWLEIAIAVRRPQESQEVDAVEQYQNAVVAAIDNRFEDWLGWAMIRIATYLASQYEKLAETVPLLLTDPRTGDELSLGEWFTRIRNARYSAVPAGYMLQSLGGLLRKRPGLIDEMPLSYALDAGVPGNDGRRARDTLKAWLDAGCPLPEVQQGKIRSIRLDASLNEEENHPHGVIMGFGAVH